MFKKNKESAFKAAQNKLDKANSILTSNFENCTNELVDISIITEPKFHDRKEYDKKKIKELAESMKNGQWQPIVLRKLKDGTLERMVGFRRIKAAKMLGWKQIDAKIYSNIDDATAIMIMTTENIQREDPNIYDQTQALVEYIIECLDLNNIEELKNILSSYKSFKAGKKDIDVNTQESISLIEKSLNKVSLEISLITFYDRLAMFDYPEYIKTALKNGLLLSYIREIIKIKDENNRKEALQEIQELFEQENITKEKAKEICQKFNNIKITKKDTTDNIKEIKKVLTSKTLNQLSAEQKKKIDKLAAEIIKIANIN